MLRGLIGGSIAVTTISIAQGAAAQEPPRFGDRGQLIVTADRLVPVLGYTSQSITASDGDITTKTTDTGGSFAFLIGREPQLGVMHTIPRVAVDVSVFPRVTIGASLAIAFGIDGAHTEERTPRVGQRTVRENAIPGSTLLGFAPRFGYVVPLGRNLTFWPRAGLAFYSMKSHREVTSNLGVTSSSTETDTIFSLDLDPQLVWTPLSHVLVHAGPLATIPITGAHETSFAQAGEVKDRSDDLTVFHFGISAGLGVWFDL